MALALTGVALFWVLILFAVPMAASSGHRSPYVTALVYGTGALVCHQRPGRSFHLRDVQMPVCARCTALYLTGAVGAVAAWRRRPRVPRRARGLLIAAALPLVLSVAAEWTGLTAGSNLLRAASALPAGLVAGWMVVQLLRGDPERMRYDLVTKARLEPESGEADLRY